MYFYKILKLINPEVNKLKSYICYYIVQNKIDTQIYIISKTIINNKKNIHRF